MLKTIANTHNSDQRNYKVLYTIFSFPLGQSYDIVVSIREISGYYQDFENTITKTHN